jgi:hypothetical protein
MDILYLKKEDHNAASKQEPRNQCSIFSRHKAISSFFKYRDEFSCNHPTFPTSHSMGTT